MVSILALAEPLAQILRLVGSGLRLCKQSSNMAAIILLQIKIKIGWKYNINIYISPPGGQITDQFG